MLVFCTMVTSLSFLSRFVFSPSILLNCSWMLVMYCSMSWLPWILMLALWVAGTTGTWVTWTGHCLGSSCRLASVGAPAKESLESWLGWRAGRGGGEGGGGGTARPVHQEQPEPVLLHAGLVGGRG